MTKQSVLRQSASSLGHLLHTRSVPKSVAQNASSCFHENKTGSLAREEGLRFPNDWNLGEVWMWRGRRTHIEDDILSGRVTNFAGHATLVTNDNEAVSFGPKPEDVTTPLDELLKWIQEKNMDALMAMNFKGSIISNDITSLHAAVAGIDIRKIPVLYSPSRLRELVNNPSLTRCYFSWDINAKKRRLNCNTFFQAWDVTMGIPWAHKFSDFYEECMKIHGGGESVGHQDIISLFNDITTRTHTAEIESFVQDFVSAEQ